jgi:hypothetical protein
MESVVSEKLLRLLENRKSISVEEIMEFLRISISEANLVIDRLELAGIVDFYCGQSMRTVLSNEYDINIGLLKNLEYEEANSINTSDSISSRIISFLQSQPNAKYSIKDLTAFIKHYSVDSVKAECEHLYYSGMIGRDGNHKYFLLQDAD